MSVPKLRFKAFDGDWTGSKLGQLIGISSASRVFKEQWQESGVPFYRTSDVISIFKNKENEKAYISLELFEELAKKSGKIQKGDLLVTGGGTIGIPYLIPNDEPLYFKDADLLWLKSSGVIDGSFLYNFFISPKLREYLKSISHTGTISHFTIEQAKETPFQFPSKPEQTKIASFLSAVDEKISQLTQKHELLSQYKQGMMQKLFSQQIRFKADDGSEFGEWEKKKLSEISIKIKDGTHFSPKTSEVGDYKYLTSKNVKDGYLDFSNLEYVTKEEHLKIYSSCDVKYGDVLLTKDGTIGQCCVNTLHEEFSLLSSVAFLRLKPEYNNYFLYHLLVSDLGQKEISSAIAGQALKRITLTKINDFSFCFPCLAEQTKIANFLSSIDQKIEVVAQQIEQAKQWKKGLLQQMFV